MRLFWVAAVLERVTRGRSKDERCLLPLAAAPPWFENQGYPPFLMVSRHILHKIDSVYSRPRGGLFHTR
jgi:hypothetical protein